MATELRRTSIARLSTDGDNKGARVVAVRYFLDRPGADLTKASVRIYQNPPAACKASDVKAYLERQNLVPAGSLCEVYLDAFEAFMAVDACDRSEVVDLHAWETDEGETNAFAAPGRSGAMVIPQDVLELRAARVKTMRQKSARNK